MRERVRTWLSFTVVVWAVKLVVLRLERNSRQSVVQSHPFLTKNTTWQVLFKFFVLFICQFNGLVLDFFYFLLMLHFDPYVPEDFTHDGPFVLALRSHLSPAVGDTRFGWDAQDGSQSLTNVANEVMESTLQLVTTMSAAAGYAETFTFSSVTTNQDTSSMSPSLDRSVGANAEARFSFLEHWRLPQVMLTIQLHIAVASCTKIVMSMTRHSPSTEKTLGLVVKTDCSQVTLTISWGLRLWVSIL